MHLILANVFALVISPNTIDCVMNPWSFITTVLSLEEGGEIK